MPTGNTSSLTLAKTIADLAIDKKGERVVSIDLKGLTSITDHFLICSADTDVQMHYCILNISTTVQHCYSIIFE